MENQKIINLLDKIDTDCKHFATKKWYIINDENNTNYGVNKDTGADNPDTIKYDTKVLKPNLCDYAEAYILVDGTIRAANANNNTRLILKTCAPFTKCNLEINDEHADTAENLDIVMPMYNLIEYSDNYQDSSATLNQYKRDEPPDADLTADNSSAFKYKIKLLGNAVVAGNIARRNVKVVVPLKYSSNFFRSLQMPLTNCKTELNLTWKKNCILSTDDGDAVFIINDTKLYIPVVTLSKEDNKDFIEQQNKGFQRCIYWNEYKTKEQTEDPNANATKYINLDASFQGVNSFFVMAYNRINAANDDQFNKNSQQKHCLPRNDLNKYNVIIDGRNFYDNPIESNIEKYRELKKVMIGKGEDYTTGFLLDYNYFNKHYKLVAVDISEQKELDANPRAIQQIDFKYMLGTNSTIYWVLEKSKETILEFYKGTVKVY